MEIYQILEEQFESQSPMDSTRNANVPTNYAASKRSVGHTKRVDLQKSQIVTQTSKSHDLSESEQDAEAKQELPKPLQAAEIRNDVREQELDTFLQTNAFDDVIELGEDDAGKSDQGPMGTGKAD